MCVYGIVFKNEFLDMDQKLERQQLALFGIFNIGKSNFKANAKNKPEGTPLSGIAWASVTDLLSTCLGPSESQGEKEMTMLLSHQQKGSKLSVLAEYRNVIHFSKLNYRETTQRAFTVQPQWLPNICTHTTVTLKLLLFPRLVLE